MASRNPDLSEPDARGRAGPVPPAALLVLSGGLAAALGYANLSETMGLVALSAGIGLVAVGGAASLIRLLALWRARRLLRLFGQFFDPAPEPMVLTDARGRVLAANPALGRALAAPAPRMLEAVLRHWGEEAAGLAHRLARRALAEGAVVAPVAAGEPGGVTLFACCAGPDRLLWTVARGAGPEREPRPDYRAAPFLHVVAGADGAILETNLPPGTMRRPPATLADLVSDPPLRPGGLHRLRESGRPVRCHAAPGPEGAVAYFLFPTDEAEARGAPPDRILDHLPVGLVRMSAEGELHFANRAALALLGERARPGARIAEIVEGLGRPIPDRLADVTRGRGPGRSEIARVRGEERDLYLQIAFARIVWDGDIAVLAVVSDATEMKTLEAQFVQSQKMQAVGQLAGGVAHDFNNLLTAISGHCDLLLLRHEFGDADHGDLLQIRQNANRAASLVRQLLAFSRKQTLRPKVLHLAETLSELTHLLNRLLGEKVTLRIENAPDLGPVRVDERQFEQVIMNLVVNARDAMPGGGEVRILTRNVTLAEDLERDRATVPAGDYVLVEVEDTGIGIPPDRIHKIFEPFYTTKKLGEGTGLGLSTVYGIVKQTGGFVFVASTPGKGSRFSIYLPRHTEDAAGEGAAEAAAPELRDLSGNGVVLLAEDEAPVRSFAARALRLRGYTVLEAASGEEALEIAGEAGQRIDVLVSDVVMPGIDGPSWVRRAREARPGVKVIFVSGYAEDVFTSGSGAVPDALFLPKPFSLNELTQKVKEILEGGRG